MAGRISEQDIQAVRERADLAAVARSHTSLTPAGPRLKGLCPFHTEKTPSFTVDPARNVWFCFGCNQGGDVFSFLEKAEALTFVEAVERLARVTGYELHYEQLTPGQRKALGRRTRLAEAVRDAARFYVDRLRADEGAAARAYLAGRGVDDTAVAHFGLGWAPDTWDALSRHLLAAGYTPDELVDAGLATQGQRGPVDRMRGRVVFPILEAGGRDVIAFGGRVLPGADLRTAPRDGTAAKYVNSPETEVYKKSRTLYGLNWARAEIQRAQVALVVEGYMDVLGLHGAGVTNVVATCGTALTADHFRMLEKHASRVVLALDADDAGMAAAEKARALAQEVGVREVGVLVLPRGQDPADLAAGGREAVHTALAGVVTAVEFQITQLLRTADVTTPEAQVAAYRRTLPLLATIGDRALRYRYVRDVVAPVVRLSADLVERELDEAVAAAGPAPAPPHDVAVVRPGDVGAPGQRDPQMQLERIVLQVAVQQPRLLGAAWASLREDDFRAPASRQLFRALGPGPVDDFDAVLAALPDDDARSRVRALAASDLEVEPDEVHVAEAVRRLRIAAVARREEEVEAEMRQLNPRAEPDRHRALYRRVAELQVLRHDLLGEAS